MLWLERKYIMLLSNNLERFKQKTQSLFIFRCPLCGDSKTNKNKTRGYIYLKSTKYLFHCHNCNQSMTFVSFLKALNPALYDQFIFDKLETSETVEQFQMEAKPKPTNLLKAISILKKVSQLSPSHPCKQYVVSRQIPTTIHHTLYYCPKFKKWTNTIVADKFSSTDNDEARLIIPLIARDGAIFGYQGRALDPNQQVRYITIVADDSYPKFYNANNVNFNKRFYVVEGPIDSMFLQNSMACCGSSLFQQLPLLNINTNNAVLVYDNQPRNKQIIKALSDSIENGYTVCLWPDHFDSKDINQMILNKVSGDYCKTELVNKAASKIQAIIDNNCFRGLQAQLRLAQWRKI